MRHGLPALAALLVTSALSTPAFAQVTPPPVRQSIDKNGVDLFLGTFNAKGPSLSFGQSQGVEYHQVNTGSGWGDNLLAQLQVSGTTYTVWLDGKSDRFTLSGGVYTNTEGNGSTLTSGTNWTYTRADGTVVTFSTTQENRATSITTPSGSMLTFNYASLRYCTSGKQGGSGIICTSHGTTYHLSSVTSNFGYQFTLQYGDFVDFDPNDPTESPYQYGWYTVTGVSGLNLAAGSGASTPTQFFSDTTIGASVCHILTDAMGRQTQFRMSGSQVAGITLPGDSTETITVGYTGGRVTSYATPAGTTSYSSSDAGNVRTVTVTDPLSHTTTYTFDIPSNRMTSVTDANGHTTSMQYDSSGRMTRLTKPEGNYTTWTYDARGNITQVDQTAKSGSGLSDIITTANYDSTCTYVAKCNKPNWTKDALGNETDYTYDTTTGNLLTVTQPAPTTGAVQPQTRYTYTQLSANYRNGSGTIISGAPAWKLTATSECQTLTSCAGTADEVKTSITYDPNQSLLPVSVSKGSGDGALTATTAMTYTGNGDVNTMDGPLPGTADTSRNYYDVMRRPLGSIGPLPGNGQPRSASRITYDNDGRPATVDVGTAAGQGDSDLANMTSLQQQVTTYDAQGRASSVKANAGGTTYSLTQESYAASGAPTCIAVRMNTATFGSPPADACTLGTQGSNGPDRITSYAHDTYYRSTSVTTGYGTSIAAAEETNSYDSLGRLSSVKEGENNLTTYVYDGMNRLSQTQYPSPTKGAGTSNSSDYEQLSYDPNGNVTSKRNRDGTSVTVSYDALNRVTNKTVPTSASGAAGYGVNYSYDNLGRQLSATFASSGLGITNSYDALSRLTSSSSNMDGTARTVSSSYDLASNRTFAGVNLSGYGAGITYDGLNRMTATAGLAQIGYDNQGRRSNVNYTWSGATTSTASYGYDSVDRLTSLTHDLAGTAADQTLTYSYNPASQITSRSSSNDSYAYNGLANVNRSYTSNGLNQYTATSSANFTFDNNGNLATDGSNTYIYDAENHLVSVSGAHNATLSYDPLGRLWQLSAGSSTTRFIYDGDHDIVETDGSGNWQREFIWGPGADEPLVQWDGGGPKALHADERGSIISLADTNGNLIGTNSYDEYGMPSSSSQGRFQYTGQAYFPEIGLYYYKARMYSAVLGRFMQSDPVGYDDGMNSYAYTHNDPVNGVDSSGLAVEIRTHWGCVSVGDGPLNCSNLITYVWVPDDPFSNGPPQPTSLFDILTNGSTPSPTPKCKFPGRQRSLDPTIQKDVRAYNASHGC